MDGWIDTVIQTYEQKGGVALKKWQKTQRSKERTPANRHTKSISSATTRCPVLITIGLNIYFKSFLMSKNTPENT